MFGILQGSMYTMQVNSQQMQCFFLSFQHKQCYNGYMGLCKAAFILFAFCFPIKSHSLRIYGTLQGSTYTMQVNPLQKQYFFFAFQHKHHHNRNLDFARQHIYYGKSIPCRYNVSSSYRSFPRFPQPAIFLSSTVGLYPLKCA